MYSFHIKHFFFTSCSIEIFHFTVTYLLITNKQWRYIDYDYFDIVTNKINCMIRKLHRKL